MDFSLFKDRISAIDTLPTGGLDAQFKLAPKIRKQLSEDYIENQQPKKAGVLALFYPNKHNDTCFLLTKRASYNGTHSAQISFPGGKFEANDIDLKNTALRETFEEVGIKKNTISVFKEMTNVYIPPSNFLVTPFLGITYQSPQFRTNHEVEELIQVTLDDFLNKTVISTTILSTSYAKEIKVPCFKLNSYIVWGATAMMLNEIRELLKNI
ncbi:NUDIX domain-containing protein [Lutibacter agarilyticus]|uniref:NUDIX domain-containing protein n=1 Tax=Lutibacter agarilyticus TaxID=1109740 RepID=A0A238XKU3_9FLAO|nr:CoA pyrophosphatase [Lutibacter agarilyticus]SNR59302.1 NUDIX domain-containing protein [Lutibacter agarilyticus]